MLCGCFRRSRSRRRELSQTPLVRSTQEPELYNADAQEEEYYSKISTYAEVTIARRKKNSGRPERERIRVIPYFGAFAGRTVVFVIDRARTQVVVDDVKISTQLDLTRRARVSVRDSCINFVHSNDCRRYDYHLPPPQPKSLQFLCKKTIHLSGILPPGTPLQEAKKFNSTAKQSVFLSVWPSDILGDTDKCSSTIKLRVPARISFGELAFYVREKLHLPSSSSLHFQESDGIYPLQPSRPLMQRHNSLECFVRTTQSPRYLTSSLLPSVLLPVMLVGRGIIEVPATPTMTIVELEYAIIQKFRLDNDTFLYIPSLFSPQLSFSSGLRMFMTANRSTALSLIDRNARRFPIVSDTDPDLKFDHRELRLYNLTLGESGLLQEDSPLLCFNVTGPTVPLSFKAYCTQSSPSYSGGSGSSGDTNSGQFSNHMIVTVEIRVISINPNWTASTLLKYIDCVSRLSSRQLLVKENVISCNERIGKLFDREWIVPSPKHHGRPTISPNVLKIV